MNRNEVELALLTLMFLMNMAMAMMMRSARVRRLEVHPAESIASTPPPTAAYTVGSEPGPVEAGRDVVAATIPLLLTTEERVAAVKAMLNRTDEGLMMIPAPAPSAVEEAICSFRREFFFWIVGDDPEIADDWWDALEGVGRWER